MMTYSEFLNCYYDMDTSMGGHSLSSTSSSFNKKSRDYKNSLKAYKEYLKEEERIKRSYDDYVKKKQDRFWRKLR